MSKITTHVLDTACGRPAQGVRVELELLCQDGKWHVLGDGTTDADGRLRTLLPEGAPLEAGTYRIGFQVGAYFDAIGIQCFYPEVSVTFRVRDERAHYHVPLLISPYGYSTYRGT
ncbi:MAG: hydroxyisourate hydrolase [Deltaproteobacteria bacterium]|nr:hydroxyisourate hydrolase [Deltaproteobacteria bacterium]